MGKKLKKDKTEGIKIKLKIPEIKPKQEDLPPQLTPKELPPNTPIIPLEWAKRLMDD